MSVAEDDTRDRLIAVEKDIEYVREKQAEIAKKVTDMHDLLMQAKGARWVILAAASVGAFVATKAAMWTGILPR